MYVWSVFSWMVLPWHNAVIHKFPEEDIVAVTIQSQAPRSGVYVVPGPGGEPETALAKMAKGPILFLSVRREGTQGMAPMMLFHLISSILIAFVVGWLLDGAKLVHYWARVGRVVLLVGIGGFLTHGAYWNWWYFSLPYSLVTYVDLLIGWFLGGLLLARSPVVAHQAGKNP